MKALTVFPVFLAILGNLVTTLAFAHSSSDAFLHLSSAANSNLLTLSASLLDLHRRFNLDDNHDQKLSWGEVKAHQAEMRAYLSTRIQLSANGNQCSLRDADLGVDRLADGNYVRFDYVVECAEGRMLPLQMQYDAFFEVDAQHRGLLQFESQEIKSVAVFSNADRSINLSESGSSSSSFTKFMVEGIQHIFSGYDHILFIICLLLPAVYVRVGHRWQPQENFAGASTEVLKALTAFTVSHSLTLALNSFALLPQIPRNVVEIGVAASILFTALNNIFVWIQGRQLQIAFGFGLIHGIGFSSVLNDLGLHGSDLLLALLGFNLGVEIAQILIVLVVLPNCFVFRKSLYFQRFILFTGSGVTAFFALIWVIERASGHKFF